MNTLEKQLQTCKDKYDSLNSGAYSFEVKNSITQLGGSYRALGMCKIHVYQIDRNLGLMN